MAGVWNCLVAHQYVEMITLYVPHHLILDIIFISKLLDTDSQFLENATQLEYGQRNGLTITGLLSITSTIRS